MSLPYTFLIALSLLHLSTETTVLGRNTTRALGKRLKPPVILQNRPLQRYSSAIRDGAFTSIPRTFQAHHNRHEDDHRRFQEEQEEGEQREEEPFNEEEDYRPLAAIQLARLAKKHLNGKEQLKDKKISRLFAVGNEKLYPDNLNTPRLVPQNEEAPDTQLVPVKAENASEPSANGVHHSAGREISTSEDPKRKENPANEGSATNLKTSPPEQPSLPKSIGSSDKAVPAPTASTPYSFGNFLKGFWKGSLKSTSKSPSLARFPAAREPEAHDPKLLASSFRLQDHPKEAPEDHDSDAELLLMGLSDEDEPPQLPASPQPLPPASPQPSPGKSPLVRKNRIVKRKKNKKRKANRKTQGEKNEASSHAAATPVESTGSRTTDRVVERSPGKESGLGASFPETSRLAAVKSNNQFVDPPTTLTQEMSSLNSSALDIEAQKKHISVAESPVPASLEQVTVDTLNLGLASESNCTSTAPNNDVDVPNHVGISSLPTDISEKLKNASVDGSSPKSEPVSDEARSESTSLLKSETLLEQLHSPTSHVTQFNSSFVAKNELYPQPPSNFSSFTTKNADQLTPKHFQNQLTSSDSDDDDKPVTFHYLRQPRTRKPDSSKPIPGSTRRLAKIDQLSSSNRSSSVGHPSPPSLLPDASSSKSPQRQSASSSVKPRKDVPTIPVMTRTIALPTPSSLPLSSLPKRTGSGKAQSGEQHSPKAFKGKSHRSASSPGSLKPLPSPFLLASQKRREEVRVRKEEMHKADCGQRVHSSEGCSRCGRSSHKNVQLDSPTVSSNDMTKKTSQAST